MKKCENPDCRLEFEPKNGRQRVCNKKSCRIWLKEYTKYKKKKYTIKRHPNIIVTKDDLIPLETNENN